MRSAKVTVFGSMVVDMVMRPAKLPSRGETVLAPGYTMHPGGKGANQVRFHARLYSNFSLAQTCLRTPKNGVISVICDRTVNDRMVSF